MLTMQRKDSPRYGRSGRGGFYGQFSLTARTKSEKPQILQKKLRRWRPSCTTRNPLLKRMSADWQTPPNPVDFRVVLISPSLLGSKSSRLLAPDGATSACHCRALCWWPGDAIPLWERNLSSTAVDKFRQACLRMSPQDSARLRLP